MAAKPETELDFNEDQVKASLARSGIDKFLPIPRWVSCGSTCFGVRLNWVRRCSTDD